MLRPSDAVRCEPLHATLSALVCARRHLAGMPSGNGKGWAVLGETCRRCEVGEERLRELRAAGVRVPKFQAFNVQRTQAEARARWRLVCEGALDEVPTIGGLPQDHS